MSREGWLSPEEAQELRDEIADLKRQLAIADKGLEIIDHLEARIDQSATAIAEYRAEIEVLHEALKRIEKRHLH